MLLSVGGRAGQTQRSSHPVLFTCMFLSALMRQCPQWLHLPAPRKAGNQTRSPSAMSQEKIWSTEPRAAPTHTHTHTRAWNGEPAREVPRNRKATFYVYMPACNAVAASLASCLPPPQPCGLSPRTVLGTVPWRPWLLLGGFGKRWNEEESEIALSARS